MMTYVIAKKTTVTSSSELNCESCFRTIVLIDRFLSVLLFKLTIGHDTNFRCNLSN